MATTLDLVIKAKDEASATLKKVDDHAGKLGSSFATLGKTAAVGAGVGIVALGGFLASSVKEAMESQKAVAQLETVLKSTGGAAGVTSGELQGWASALQKTTAFSDEAVIGAENLLLTFTNIKGPALKEATSTVLDMSTALGQDLKSSSIQVGKALNDPIRGITALRRVGVSFTKEQEAQIKVLQESGDVMGAQKIILAELSKEFGGSAVAAGKTFGGRMTILKNQLGELQERVGFMLLPVLTTLAKFMTDNLPPAIAFVEETVRQMRAEFEEHVLPVLQDVAGFLKDEVVPVFQDFFEKLDKFVGKKAELVGAIAAVAAIMLVLAATAVVAAAGMLIAWAPALALIAAAGVLAAGLVVLDEKTGIVTDSFNFLSAEAQKLWDWLGPKLSEATENLVQLWNTNLYPALTTVGNFLIDKLEPVLGKVVGWLEKHPEAAAIAAGAILTLVAPWAAVGIAGAAAAIYIAAEWDKLKNVIAVNLNQQITMLNKWIRAWNSVMDTEILGKRLGPHIGEIGYIDYAGLPYNPAPSSGVAGSHGMDWVAPVSGTGSGQNNPGMTGAQRTITSGAEGGLTVNFNSTISTASPAEMQRAAIQLKSILRGSL